VRSGAAAGGRRRRDSERGGRHGGSPGARVPEGSDPSISDPHDLMPARARQREIPMRLHLDARSPIPIRWQLTEQLRHAIEGGGVPRDRALPSIRELAGFLRINPNTVARAIEDLKRSGHVEARRGKGVFVAPARSARPFPTRREIFLKDAVIRAAALEMTPDEVAVGVLSVAGLGLAASRGAVSVLLVECSPAELDFFGRELEAQLPVRVDKVPLSKLAGVVRRRKGTERWTAAVTSVGHLPEVDHRLEGLGVPVVALLAEVHLETLHRLAQLPAGTRVGVVSAERETAHNLEHSIANAALPNLARVETSSAEGPALGRLVRRVDAIVCSSAAAARVQGLVRPTVPVIVDDRALNQRAIQMLGAILAQQDGDHPAAPSPGGRRRPRALQASPAGSYPGGDSGGTVRLRRGVTR
jgi:GntR family transcriptional regulator